MSKKLGEKRLLRGNTSQREIDGSTKGKMTARDGKEERKKSKHKEVLVETQKRNGSKTVQEERKRKGVLETRGDVWLYCSQDSP